MVFIPGWIPTYVSELISDCWSDDSENRSIFKDIFEVLRRNEFKISRVIESYVESIESEERNNAARGQTLFDLADYST
jgi:hypothetical protein